jgi:hypothetical protein
MSGIFGSTVIKGNRLTEFSETTATVGTVKPFGYGRFTSSGNVMWAPLPPKEHVTKKRQGKGGVKQEVYTYTLSYAVGFAKGPIYGYWWIKRRGKVVWTQDPNAPIEDAAYAAKWAEKVAMYFGTKDQLPDSTIESYEGTGQVSAFRDDGYIVVEEDDVTDGGGAVPTYEACVIASPPEAYLTSHPYPLLIEEAASYGLVPTDGQLRQVMFETLSLEKAVYGVTPIGGQLRTNFQITGVQPSFSSYAIVPTSGELRTAIRSTGAQPSKASYGLVPSGGTLAAKLLTTNVQPSKASYGLTPTGGTLA